MQSSKEINLLPGFQTTNGSDITLNVTPFGSAKDGSSFLPSGDICSGYPSYVQVSGQPSEEGINPIQICGGQQTLTVNLAWPKNQIIPQTMTFRWKVTYSTTGDTLGGPGTQATFLAYPVNTNGSNNISFTPTINGTRCPATTNEIIVWPAGSGPCH
jgi:hypothetical protein